MKVIVVGDGGAGMLPPPFGKTNGDLQERLH